MLKKNLDIITNWIPEGAHVLDVGCGKGHVLKALKHKKNIHGYGIEKDPNNVYFCIKSGLNVTQASIETISKDFQPS